MGSAASESRYSPQETRREGKEERGWKEEGSRGKEQGRGMRGSRSDLKEHRHLQVPYSFWTCCYIVLTIVA